MALDGDPAEDPQDLIQQTGDLGESTVVVQQPDHRAQQNVRINVQHPT